MFARTSNPDTPCARCGNCCRWPGFVRITPEETEAIARFLGLDPRAFADRHTRLLPNRAGLALAEAGDGACVFLDANACRIHPVKPRQCRDFPDRWTRKEPALPCPLRVTQTGPGPHQPQ